MSDFVTLSCPSCGGKLEITQDIDRFACMHCGREQVVKRRGGIISISPMVDAIKKVEIGVDKTASELAIIRVQKEIDGLVAKKYALLNSSPQPKVSPIFAILPILGCITLGTFLLLISNIDTSASPDAPVVIIVGVLVGIGMILAGVIPSLVLHPTNTKSWNKTTGVQLKSLDGQIATKNAELQRHQNVVSR